MDLDRDTFLTTVYCIVDDLYPEQIAPQRPVRRGGRPQLSESEVGCLALLAQWQGQRSEQAFGAFAVRRLRPWFPRRLSQSARNRPIRDLCGARCRRGPAIAERAQAALGHTVTDEVTDGAPVPVMRRCRSRKQQWLGDEAGIGKGGSDRQWYFGVHLLLRGSPAGHIGGRVEGPAPTEERWLLETLLRWRQYPDAGPPQVAELAAVLTKGEYGADTPLPVLRRMRHWSSGLRQAVETVNGWLEDQLGLWYPRAHTYWGLRTRLAAKIAAFNSDGLHQWTDGTTAFRTLHSPRRLIRIKRPGDGWAGGGEGRSPKAPRRRPGNSPSESGEGPGG